MYCRCLPVCYRSRFYLRLLLLLPVRYVDVMLFLLIYFVVGIVANCCCVPLLPLLRCLRVMPLRLLPLYS